MVRVGVQQHQRHAERLDEAGEAREQGGVGAARLYQRRCEGCRLELNMAEVGDVKAASPETVLRCENCHRILVRTAESGL